MNALMGGTHYHTPQTIFQHMMGGQQNIKQDGPQWMQVPQVPSISMPWSIPTSQSDIIRFGEDRSQQNYGLSLHQKRKLDSSEMIEMRQAKQFITEEKMAAHFRDLHISSKTTAPAEPAPSTSTVFKPMGSQNTYATPVVDITEEINMDNPLIMDSDSSKSGPRLVMSEELKRFQQESILPVSLLSKLERPSMALVLWEPPNKHLRQLLGSRDMAPPMSNTAEDDENNNNRNSVGDHNIANNNNESIPDLNAMITDVPELESMDL